MSIFTYKEVGTYVIYKNSPYIVAKLWAVGSKYTLVSPTKPKVLVNISNTTPINCKPAVYVLHNFGEYLVTNTKLIISLKTQRIMKWDDTNGDRIAILNLATTK